MIPRPYARDNALALIGGPLVWTLHFLVIYIFTAIACAQGFFHEQILGVRVVPLVGGIATLVAVLLIGYGIYVSFRRWRGRPWDGPRRELPPHDRNDVASRRRFMAFAGLLLSGAALIATVWEALPILFFSSCL